MCVINTDLEAIYTNPEDHFIYNFMFMEGLQDKNPIYDPESLHEDEVVNEMVLRFLHRLCLAYVMEGLQNKLLCKS